MNTLVSPNDFWAVVVTMVFGFLAVYLLLPRVRGYPRWLGGAAAEAPLALNGRLCDNGCLV